MWVHIDVQNPTDYISNVNSRKNHILVGGGTPVNNRRWCYCRDRRRDGCGIVPYANKTNVQIRIQRIMIAKRAYLQKGVIEATFKVKGTRVEERWAVRTGDGMAISVQVAPS